ncbi:MAG: helix-turn-helix domain-containing protein [Actinomycetota bacterium]
MSDDSPPLRSECPVAASLDLLGDRWTLLILRDVLIGGVQHFADFAADEQIAPNTLTDRLRRLTAAGLIGRRRDSEDGRRWRYVPLEPAVLLIPVLLDFMVWGTKHTDGTAPDWLLQAIASDRDGLIEQLSSVARARRDR